MPSRTFGFAFAAVALIAAGAVLVATLTRDAPPPFTGDVIAYSCKEKKNPWYAVCLIRADGSEARRVTSALATTDPDWSPDGRRIAFTRNQDVGESTGFTSDDVFVMDADGSDLRQLTPDEQGLMSGQPTWSPDGAEIAFVRGQSVASVVPSRYGSLHVVDADGGEARRLGESRTDADPDWSPNGSEIVFVHGEDLASPTDANDDIFVLDLTTGVTRQLTRTPPGIYEAAPAWSPDGSRIAFARVTSTSEFDGTASIHVLRRDGTGERLVLAHRLYAYSPYSLAWSPDGRTIAFETSSTIGCTSISLVDVETRAVRALTSCTRPVEASAAPVWQPVADDEVR